MAEALPTGVSKCLNCIYEWRDVAKRKYEENPDSERGDTKPLVGFYELLDHHTKECRNKRPKVRMSSVQRPRKRLVNGWENFPPALA